MDKEFIRTLKEIEHFVSSFSSIHTYEHLISTIQINIANIAPHDNIALYLFDNEENKLKLFLAKGFTDSEKQVAESTAMNRHPGYVFRTGNILWKNDYQKEDEEIIVPAISNSKTRSRLYVPVKVSDDIIGVFGIQSNLPNAFTEKHLLQLKVFASLTGGVYFAINSNKKIKEQNLENEKLSTIVRQIKTSVIITDAQGRVTWVNEQFEKATEFQLAEIMGKTPGSFLTGKNTEPDKTELLRFAIKNQIFCKTTLTNYTKSGKEFKSEMQLSPVFNKQGKLDSFIAVQQDITKEIKLQYEIENQKLFYENILNNIPGNVAVFDEQGKYLFVNPNTVKNPEIREWLIGKDNFDYCKYKGLSDELAVEREKQFELLRQNGSMVHSVEKKLEKDGTYSYMSSFMRFLEYKGAKLIVAYGIDITAIKNAEDEIDRLSNFYEKLLDNIPEDIAVYDETGIFVYLNPSAVKDSELREWLIGKDHYDYCNYRNISSSFADQRRTQYEALLQSGTPLDFVEEKILKDGDVEYIQRQLTSFVVQNKRYVLAYGVDISEIKKNETSVSKLKQFYETILEKLPADIAIFDKNHKYLYLNPVAIKDDTLRKYIIGKDDFEYARYRGRDTAEVEVRRKKFLEAAKVKKAVSWEDEMTDPNGNVLTKLRVFYPVINPSERLEFMIGYGIDVTDIKQNQQKVIKNEAKIKTIMQSAHDAIIIIDAHGVISFANPATEKMFGWEMNEMINKPIKQTTFHHRLMPFLNKELKKYKNNNTNTVFNQLIESFAYKKSGEKIQIELTVIPLEVDGEISFCAFIKDISERKKNEKVIMDFNLNLEKKIKQRTGELESAVRELDSFSYSVSHDLKAPLRGISGYTMALHDDYSHILDEDGQTLIKKISSSTARMGLLIDSMLQLSKVGRADILRTDVDISELSEEIIERIMEVNLRRDIKFVVEPNLNLNCDKKLFEILLTNLISNAIKFSNKVECPEIQIGKTFDRDFDIFFVKDNGAGFNMKAATKLFGAFQRLHVQTDFEGTGIGLATVQRVINIHGGRIWAESKVDEGATFYFQLNNQVS